ncbi:N-formylglutamate amidohydrolase [Myxococcota bacterium]|nr:N-formylglutamate amidohydrolase [Myxococcota bacterium]
MTPALLVTAPHSAVVIPEGLRDRLLVDDAAVWAAHDLGTAQLAACLGAEHVALGEVSRLVLDLDHELPDDGRADRRFPAADAAGRRIWATELDTRERESLLDAYYRPWYAGVRAAREALTRSWGRLLHVDLNAWGRADGATAADLAAAPPLLLANGGYPVTGEGERVSCRADLLRALAEHIEAETGLKVGVNLRFKGGGVLRTFGHHPGSTVQLTVQRALLSDDDVTLDADRAEALGLGLERAITAWRRASSPLR